MPYDITRQFPRTIMNLFEHAYTRQTGLVTVNLGGTSGSSGGTGGPPGGFYGLLPQKYVTYDTTEAATSGSVGGSGSTPSLVDNLDRIRFWMKPARWFEPDISSGNLNIAPGIWWTSGSSFLTYAGGNIATPASGMIYLDSSGSICNDASWPASGTYNPVCEIAGSVITKDVRKFFNEGGAGAVGEAHNLLSATHTDTLATTPPGQGSLIVGNSTPVWSELVLGGAAGSFLIRDANDPYWSLFYFSGTAGGTTSFLVTNGETLTLTAAGSYNITFPNSMAFPADAEGYLKNTSGSLTWAAGTGGATLTATYVGFGDAGDLLTGSANLTWDNTRLLAQISDTATNTIVYPVRVGHVTSDTAAVGFGAGIEFQSESNNGTMRIGTSLDALWKDATNAAEVGQLKINVMSNGTLRDAIVITGFSTTPAVGNARGLGSIDLQMYRAAAANVASGEISTIVGGQSNTASAPYTTIVGGVENLAGQVSATIVGGSTNTISGGNNGNSIIIGGVLCVVSSDYAFAAGTRVHLTHDGSFGWADTTAADFHSIVANEFAIRATGGFRHAYDDTYYWTAQVDSAGAVTFATTGTTFQFSDYVGIGIAPRYLFDVAGTGVESKISVQRSSGSAASAASSAGVRVIRSRGETTASPSAILSGDHLGYHEYAAYYDATNITVGAYLSARATENWDSTHKGTKLVWGVTVTGGVTGTEPLELDPVTGLLCLLPITISNAAPSLVMTDTTGGAKGLTIAVDANFADIRESAAAAASLLYLDLTNNRVGLGMTPSYQFHAQGTATAGTGVFGFDRYTNNAVVRLRRANGTPASPTASAANDVLGSLACCGYHTDGTPAFGGDIAAIRFYAAENTTSTNQGTYICLLTSAIGAKLLTEKVRITDAGSLVIGTAALATNATDGFLYIPSCAGAPTGAPTAYAGRIPIVFDSANDAIYVYNGSWKHVHVA